MGIERGESDEFRKGGGRSHTSGLWPGCPYSRTLVARPWRLILADEPSKVLRLILMGLGRELNQRRFFVIIDDDETAQEPTEMQSPVPTAG